MNHLHHPAWSRRSPAFSAVLATLAAGALGFLLIAPLGCGKAPGPTAAPTPTVHGDRLSFPAGAPQLATFRVEPAAVEPLAPLTLTGRLSWNEDATVRVIPPVAGRVVRLAAALGARVPAGGLLAELSSPDFGQAQADASRAATDLSVAERSRDRVARLYERGAAPRKDLDAAEADLARARAESQRAAARLKRWGGDLASLASGPDQLYRVAAPFAGVVVERNANPGQEVRPDAPTPLFVVSDPRTLWVLLDVSARDLAAVRAGARLTVRTPAWPERAFSGRLDVVGDALDPATRTVKARGTVENTDSMLKAEMYVSVEEAGPPLVGPTVPARAVLTDGSTRFCFVEEQPGTFRRVIVTAGPERGGRVPILSGLPDGARIVTDGSLLLSALLPAGPRS